MSDTGLDQLTVKQPDATHELGADDGEGLDEYLADVEATVAQATEELAERTKNQLPDWDAMTGGTIPNRVL